MRIANRNNRISIDLSHLDGIDQGNLHNAHLQDNDLKNSWVIVTSNVCDRIDIASFHPAMLLMSPGSTSFPDMTSSSSGGALATKYLTYHNVGINFASITSSTREIFSMESFSNIRLCTSLSDLHIGAIVGAGTTAAR